MAIVLREQGHQKEAVLDSQEGLTRLTRAHYDLVICDLRMPRLDGPAFSPARDGLQRLQTVVELAVRLRETIRRLSDAWESRAQSVRV